MRHQIYWTPQKIAQRLELIQPLEYQRLHPLPAFRFKELSDPLEDPPIGAETDDSDWDKIEANTYWGRWITDFALRTTFRVPSDWHTNSPVALYLPLGEAGDFSHPEALAYIDGRAYASADRHHHEILLPEQYHDGQSHLLALHGWTGLGGWRSDSPHTKLFMRECAVAQIHRPTRELIALVRVALGVAEELDEDDPVKGRLYNALDAAFKILDTRDPLGKKAFYESVPEALNRLKSGIEAAGASLDVDIIGIGHAHIDVAWLWTLGQTRRKAGRTFSNVLRLMEQYPDYHFSQSQPQLYQYTEEHYPEIFAGIKHRVAEGRWEIMGGTWVEPDCNATGAESLARQFLLGRSYFRKHFGDVETPVLWLPDTFGYSWALPQLIKQAGMKYFITHKMSWNQYNQMPYQLLWWQGLDGTRVLTHFLTTPFPFQLLENSTTYNGVVSAREVFGTWQNFKQKEIHNELITAYGYGDGGGGPTREMLENIQHLSNHPGAPRMRYGTVREFMERVERETGEELPVWNGEFYLELHRGTLTSQSRTKRNNRKSEFLLHDAEFLAAYAALVTDYNYPHETFNQAWELVCLNQFHDILPGSSITPVYVDSNRDYAIIRELAERARDEAITALARNMPQEVTHIAINPTSFRGDRIGLLADSSRNSRAFMDTRSGQALLAQQVENGTLIAVPSLEPYSPVALAEEDAQSPAEDTGLAARTENDLIIFENNLIRVEFNASGDITRIFDKEAAREILPEGAIANALLAFEDRPVMWDAWDIDIFFEDRPEKINTVESMAITENGPIRLALTIKRLYRDSSIVQNVYLYHNGKRIDFDTRINWREHHILLKAAFPVNILSPRATFEIQWGNVERATHRNTSWDWARFETAAQKWADLSEGNYGVALLNDCKYGYEIKENVLRLSLLKSATSPDPEADQGEHHMVYSLLPHTGDWRNGVPAEAYDLNDPLILRRIQGGGNTPSPANPLITADTPGVIIETIKEAEDGDGIIARLYENERNHGRIVLTAGFPLARAYHCNLLEENESELVIEDNRIQMDIRPYQIATLRLIPHSG